MANLEENPTGRRFLATPADAQPSELFENLSATLAPGQPVRFARRTDAHEILIFISGVCNSGGAAPDRAVYAYVWGPRVNGQKKDNHEVNDLDPTLGPQTAERAQLQAAIKALVKAVDLRTKYEEMCNMGDMSPGDRKFWDPRKVLIAFDGDYFLNQVACSTYKLEQQKGGDNLDLKQHVEAAINSLEGRGIKVQFWLLDEFNFAEEYALAQLR